MGPWGMGCDDLFDDCQCRGLGPKLDVLILNKNSVTSNLIEFHPIVMKVVVLE